MPLSEPKREGLWQCLARGASGEPVWFAVALSDHLPDNERIELPHAEASDAVGDRAVCLAHYAADGSVSSLAVTQLCAPKAPPLWFVEITQPDDSPPASNLVAFTDHGVEAGSLLDPVRLGDIAVESADQLAAIRWYPATGEADQIYVSPAWRRRTIGTAIPLAASTLNMARGLPRLWGDGQRTAMGDRMIMASPYSHRVAKLTHLAPPMTPFDQRDSD